MGLIRCCWVYPELRVYHIPEGWARAGQHSPAPKPRSVFVCCLCPEQREHLQRVCSAEQPGEGKSSTGSTRDTLTPCPEVPAWSSLCSV